MSMVKVMRELYLVRLFIYNKRISKKKSRFFVIVILGALTKLASGRRRWLPNRQHIIVLSFLIFAISVFFASSVSASNNNGIFFVKNASTNIGSFPSSLPNNSFRIDTSTTNSASVTSTTANFVGSSSATLSPTTGWTQVVSANRDDGNIEIPFGFNTTFNGTSYNGAFVGSNTYITFGSGSSVWSSLSAGNPALPGVHLCARDNSYQKVFYKLDSAGVMRVRYEGNNATSGVVGTPTIVYEAVFYGGQSYFDLHMGINSACPAPTAPTVLSVSSDKPNGSYKAGEVIDINVIFSEAVTSTGNVTVTLETGVIDRTCTFTITNSTTGTCNYIVQAGDTSPDLNVNSVSGTIRNGANVALTNTTPTTNLAANKAIVIDTTAPTVGSLNSSLANGSYRVGQVVPIQVVFSESVTVAGGTPRLVITTGSPATTTLNYASGSGTNTLVFNYTVAASNFSSDLSHGSTTALSLNGATIRDTAGNNATLTLPAPYASGSLAANKAIVIDNTAPTVAITSTSPSLTNAHIPVVVTFSESVSNFVAGDISVTNGTAGSFSGSGASYTFTVTPTSQGVVTINIPVGSASDAAGNTSSVSNTISSTYDSVVPTVALTTPVSSPTLQTPIPFTATFSEAVTGFNLADITVASGTAGNFVAVSPTVYTFDVSPTGHLTLNVEVYVSIAGGKAQDIAGNNNSASDSGTPYNIRFDNHSPTVSLTSAASEPTNSSSIAVTASFSESVTGFVEGDLLLTNATASSFSGSGTTYTFTLTPSGQGVMSVQVPASVSQDDATNLNLVSNMLSRTYDSVSPTVSLSSSSSNPTNSSPISVTATFSEPITGFVEGDISLSNATSNNFTGSGTTYTFDLTPSGQGSVSATIPGSVAQDDAGNNNSASSALTLTYDTQGPAIDEVTPISLFTNSMTPSYTFSSSEAGTITYSGDCSSGTTSASSGNNTISFSALTEGEYNNCAIVVADALGNISNVLVVSAFTVDTVSPTVTLSSGEPSITNVSPISVTATFSESVTGFVVGNLTLNNATVSNFEGSGTTYTFDITPSGQGAVSVTVPESAAQDDASNSNLVSNTLPFTYDTVAPDISSIVFADTILTLGETSIVTITFSETVIGFTNNDITTIENGTLSAVSSSDGGTTWTATFTPNADTFDDTNIITITKSGITDVVGNAGVSKTSSSNYVVNTIRPSVSSEAIDIAVALSQAEQVAEVVALNPQEKIILNHFSEYTQEGKKLDLAVNQVIHFTVGSNEHSVTITNITDDYVTFVLRSTPQYAKLKIGETGRYDVDNDGIFDIEVTATGISGRFARINFKQLIQPEQEGSAIATPISKPFDHRLWFLLSLPIGGVLLIIIKKKKRNSDTLYN